MKSTWLVGALVFGIFGIGSAAGADDVFKGKQVTVAFSAGAGGSMDHYTRLLSRHLGRHLPGNPTVIVKSVPGAGSAVLATQMTSSAPKDGTFIGHINRALLLAPMLIKPFPFDLLNFPMLGSMNRDTIVLIVSNRSKVQTFEDAKRLPLVLAAEGVDTDGVVFPRLMNRFLGTKFQPVPGYSGDAAMMLAVERGEADGRGGVPWGAVKVSGARQLKDGSLKVILQMTNQRSRELPDVPMLLDHITDVSQRHVLELLFSSQEMGRPFVLPPGVPEERVALLRKAFVDTMNDPVFLEDAKKTGLDTDPMNGRDMQALMKRLYATPPETVELAKRVLREAVESR
jgi:tripartite-type tricarboxylate transporter receptor subunit TctC